MGKKPPKITVLIAVVFLASMDLACRKVTFVSFSEAEKTGDEYYRHLQSDGTVEAMKLYSSEFVDAQFRARWASFLADRAVLWGPCKEYSLQGARFAPRVGDDPNVPADECYVMTYSVTYATMTDRETMLLCPDPADRVLRIVGQRLERDGVDPITAGIMVEYSGITVGQ